MLQVAGQKEGCNAGLVAAAIFFARGDDERDPEKALREEQEDGHGCWRDYGGWLESGS